MSLQATAMAEEVQNNEPNNEQNASSVGAKTHKPSPTQLAWIKKGIKAVGQPRLGMHIVKKAPPRPAAPCVAGCGDGSHSKQVQCILRRRPQLHSVDYAPSAILLVRFATCIGFVNDQVVG